MEHISKLTKNKRYPFVMKSNTKNFRNIKIPAEDINKWKWEFLKLINAEFYKGQQRFVIDDTNRAKIAFCFDWIVGNIDISLNKGLILRGDVGTGKSSILKAIKMLCQVLYNNEKGNLYPKYITADSIARLYNNDFEESEIKLNQLFTTRLLFIDDIGYEAIKVYDHHPIPEIIRDRYDKKRITCITTNLTMSELAERYGKSFEDKLNEMCFIIKFDGDSKRN
jgi:DNA replication protein DnaC